MCVLWFKQESNQADGLATIHKDTNLSSTRKQENKTKQKANPGRPTKGPPAVLFPLLLIITITTTASVLKQTGSSRAKCLKRGRRAHFATLPNTYKNQN